MPFPYGGKATYSDLASKFGWPTVIISPILLPFTFLLTNLLLNPFFIPKAWKYASRQYAWYLEGGDDIWRQKQYFNKKNECGSFTGWNCYIDKEGGKLYESIWGFMNCLDADIKHDCVIMTPNAWTWIVAKVYAEFDPNTPCKGHRIRFYFGLGGLNQYNPFCWASVVFALSSLTLFGKRGRPVFRSKFPMRSTADNFPKEDEDPADLLVDGSMPYFDPEKKEIYGTIS